MFRRLLQWLTMKAAAPTQPLAPSAIVRGGWYESLRGGFCYEVEKIEFGSVFYTVVDTGQRCQTSREDFAERVGRRLQIDQGST
jgi:hypothetical protein